MPEKAQTFPLCINRLAAWDGNKQWMTSGINTYSKMEQKRVCYPDLELWRPKDGTRKLIGEHEATFNELRGNDDFLGVKMALQERWSIEIEGAYRRMGGSDIAAIPTIMVVAWSENCREISAEDEELWVQACNDVVAFLRAHDAAYFGVEIIHWDKLDYQVLA